MLHLPLQKASTSLLGKDFNFGSSLRRSAGLGLGLRAVLRLWVALWVVWLCTYQGFGLRVLDLET